MCVILFTGGGLCQGDPPDRDPLDRDPPGQRPPSGQRPPWTETPQTKTLQTETPRAETPWTETPQTETPRTETQHEQRPPQTETTHTVTSGRYASYWNAFLFTCQSEFYLQEIRKSGVKTGWTPGTMSIKVTDLPGRVEDVHMKMFVLFERRLSRHYSSKVKFCVSCFYNCLDLKGYYADEIVNKMVSSASSLCISTILQQLQEGLRLYYVKCLSF